MATCRPRANNIAKIKRGRVFMAVGKVAQVFQTPHEGPRHQIAPTRPNLQAPIRDAPPLLRNSPPWPCCTPKLHPQPSSPRMPWIHLQHIAFLHPILVVRHEHPGIGLGYKLKHRLQTQGHVALVVHILQRVCSSGIFNPLRHKAALARCVPNAVGHTAREHAFTRAGGCIRRSGIARFDFLESLPTRCRISGQPCQSHHPFCAAERVGFEVFRHWHPRPIPFRQILIGTCQNAPWIHHGDDFRIQPSIPAHISNGSRVRQGQHSRITHILQRSAPSPSRQPCPCLEQMHMGGACRHEALVAVDDHVRHVLPQCDPVSGVHG